MNRIHNLGGMANFGPIDPQPAEPVVHKKWEGRVFAISLATVGVFGPIDRIRHAIERMDPSRYLSSSYYEHWLAGFETLAKEFGILSEEEIATGILQSSTSSGPPPLSAKMIEGIIRGGVRATSREKRPDPPIQDWRCGARTKPSSSEAIRVFPVMCGGISESSNAIMVCMCSLIPPLTTREKTPNRCMMCASRQGVVGFRVHRQGQPVFRPLGKLFRRSLKRPPMSKNHHNAPVNPYLEKRRSELDNKALEERVRHIEELLIRKGLVSKEALDKIIDIYENDLGPMNDARVVARAWVDSAYKARLLADGTAAIKELEYSGLGGEHLVVVENTPTVHNIIVCTLCSCYPWPVLGLPPVWYKSPPYRSRVVAEPRRALQEFGVELDEDVEVRVWDSSSEVRYFVLPEPPSEIEGMSETQLADLVTRDAVIGVAKVTRP